MTRPDWEYRLQSIRHTADVGLAETAKAAEYFQAEGVIISGTATGCPTDPAGVTPENMTCFAAADALIVGSSVKERGLWFNPLEEARVRAVAHAFREI